MSLSRIKWLVLTVWLALGSPLISAQEIDTSGIRSNFLQLENSIRANALAADDIDQAVAKVSAQRAASNECITREQLNISRLKSERATLGLDEDSDVSLSTALKEELAVLSSDLEKIQRRTVDCQLLSNRADNLLASLTDYKGSLLLLRLKEQNIDAIDAVKTLYAQRSSLLESLSAVSATVWRQLIDGLTSRTQWLYFGLVAFLVGVYVTFFRRDKTEELSQERGFGSFNRFSLALREAMSHFAIVLLPLTVVSMKWLLVGGATGDAAEYVRNLSYCLTVFVWSMVMIRATLEPANEQWLFVPVQPRRRIALANRLRGLLVLVLVYVGLQLTTTIAGMPVEMANVLGLLLRLAIGISLIWLLWVVDSLEKLEGRGRGLRSVLVLILLVALLADLTGYQNFSAFLIQGFIGTLVAFSLLWLLNEFTKEVFDGLDTGKREWHRNIRTRLSVEPGEHISGLVWFRFLALILVWIVAAMVFLQSWNVWQVSWAWFSNAFSEGFSLGDTQLVPAKMLLGVMLFATVLLLSNAIKKRLTERSTLLARLEPSAKETAVTLTGYTGFLIALLIGLSLAGFSFQNLAIVAGALSVGIGFGLQNIVNNFVSGIILLFERPIRRGDWVVVGGTEGFVKNIRVRSTEIETFDRSDVMVPNSEFISQQVTNMTLNDQHGRVKVAVGVAYGSDTGLVKELLLRIAEEHDQVLKEGNYRRVPPPQVLFIGFGDSSLDFELRGFVRDIRMWPIVKSDLNFAIDAAFRENQIEIPFPQRDVHVIPPSKSEAD
ncbi:MAG: mechanosensitive ion channel family protein [Pseudomonadales bacterium]